MPLALSWHPRDGFRIVAAMTSSTRQTNNPVIVTLPDSLRTFLDEQVATGYDSAGDYIRALLLRERRTAAQGRLEALLLEGLDTPVEPMTKNDWAEIRETVDRRLNRRRRSE